jgi:hypothetical protein
MSFATEQLERIETLLAENPGVKTIAVGYRRRGRGREDEGRGCK